MVKSVCSCREAKGKENKVEGDHEILYYETILCMSGWCPVSWIRWSQRMRTRDTVIYMKAKRKVEWELGEGLVLGRSF